MRFALLVVLGLVLLAGCATQDTGYSKAEGIVQNAAGEGRNYLTPGEREEAFSSITGNPTQTTSMTETEAATLIQNFGDVKQYLQFSIPIGYGTGSSTYYDCDPVQDSEYDWSRICNTSDWSVTRTSCKDYESITENGCVKFEFPAETPEEEHSQISHYLGGAAYDHITDHYSQEELNHLFFNEYLSNAELKQLLPRYREIASEITEFEKQGNPTVSHFYIMSSRAITLTGYETWESSAEMLSQAYSKGAVLAVTPGYEEGEFEYVQVVTAAQEYAPFLDFVEACAASGGGMTEYYD